MAVNQVQGLILCVDFTFHDIILNLCYRSVAFCFCFYLADDRVPYSTMYFSCCYKLKTPSRNKVK